MVSMARSNITIAPGPLLAAARNARSARRASSPRVVACCGACAKPACALTRITVSSQCGRVMTSRAARIIVSGSISLFAVIAIANSSLAMRPHIAWAGNASFNCFATATMSSSLPSTPLCAVISSILSSSISTNVVHSSSARSARARSRSSRILAWFGNPVSLSSSAARAAASSRTANSRRTLLSCLRDAAPKPTSTTTIAPASGASRFIVSIMDGLFPT